MTERKKQPIDHKVADPGREALGGNGSLSCEEWELLLTEALDGLLPAQQRTAFDTHGAECAVCAGLLREAKQGQEWLGFLSAEPEVPADLVERIVGRTSGMAAGGPLAVAAAGAGNVPVPVHLLGLPVRRAMWDTRMMMTIAMAFFSIALTLNLAGVRLTNLKLSDLTPASMEMNLTRQFYGAKGSLVRYYDNLRLVYEVESKMRDLKKAEQMQQARPQQQQQQQVPANPQGNGHKNGGKLAPQVKPETKVPREGTLWGTPVLASVERSCSEFEQVEQEIANKEEGASIAVFCGRVQAERSL
jgi:hypothetical protein